MTRQVHAKLAQHAPGRADTERFLLRYLSEPKATTVFDAPRKALSRAEFRRSAISRGIRVERRTRIIYANNAMGINGEWIEPPPDSLATLKNFGDQRVLAPRLTRSLPATVWPLLHDWYTTGWIIIAD